MVRKTILQKTILNLKITEVDDKSIISLTFDNINIQTTFLDWILVYHTLKNENLEWDLLNKNQELKFFSKISTNLNSVFINLDPCSVKIVKINLFYF